MLIYFFSKTDELVLHIRNPGSRPGLLHTFVCHSMQKRSHFGNRERERADYHPVDFNAIFFSRAAKLKEVIKMRVKRQF